MNYPLLIAHTPRAGQWNRLNLLPDGGGSRSGCTLVLRLLWNRLNLLPDGGGGLPVGFNPADYLAMAAQNEVGGNYLAVSKEVTQPTTGRLGREVLALVGVAPVDEIKRERIMTQLRKHLDDVGELVEGYPWDTHDGSDLRLTQLDDWCCSLREKEKLQSHPHQNETPLRADEQGRQRWVSYAAIGVMLVLAVIGLVVWEPWKVSVPGSGTPTTEKTTGGGVENPPDEWKQFLGESFPSPMKRDDEAEHKLVKHIYRAIKTDLLPKVLENRLEGSEPWPPKELRKDLWGVSVFRNWLKKAYPKEQRTDDWIYLGEIGNEEKKRIAKVLGEPKSIAEVTTETERLAMMYDFLVECSKLKLPASDVTDERVKELFPVIDWHRAISKARFHEKCLRPVPLPFLSTADVTNCGMILGQLEVLDSSLKDEKLYQDPVFSFSWPGIRKLKESKFVETLGPDVKPDQAKKTQIALLPKGYKANPTLAQEALELLKGLADLLRRIER